MDRTENTIPLLLYPNVAMETRLFAKPLLSNVCFIFAYLTVIAQQRVSMPHCSSLKAICPKEPTGE
jgi:hypothetical protein